MIRLASPLTEADHLSLPSSSVSASPLTQNVPPIPLPPLEGPLGGRYRHHVGALGEHDAHETCPDALNCLPDTEGRPQHTLPIILRCAILGSPKKRMTIREIYAAMEEKYPYYRTAGQTWKQSVRHHLSLNRLFERQPRPVTDPGFGSYWTVN
ncbi:winged helix DNA-binding domain-containing protein, partial [Peniophora sp. CONT]